MFNLLRRSKNKKSKNKIAEETEDAAALNSSSANQQNDGTRTTAGGVTERYRQFSELESEVGLPTIGAAIRARPSNIRAPIEELEDLRDLDEDDEDEKQATAYGHINNENDDRIYFERCTDRLWEKEKVNLAKTAANFTANVPTAAAAAVVAITARTKNSKSNSAIKPNKKAAFAFSQRDVDRINKLVAVAALDAGDGDGRESSQNELAEWQGHVSPIGNRKIIDKSIKRSESEIEQFKFSPISPISSTSTTTRSSKSKQFNTSDLTAEDAERSVVDPTTNGNNSRSTADTVINEVRYRNLGNSQQSVKKKSSEAKRQSRLSLTSLGLNLTSGKSKSVAETTTTDDGSRPVVKRSDLERQSIRRSFFHNNKSKSIDSDQVVIDSNEQKSRPNSNLFYKETSEVDRKLNPLQKSREFLSEIFMARGRNHNRNRNQPQQHQQIQQQHEQQQSHSTKAPQEPCKYAAVSSDSHIHHNKNNRNEPAAAANTMNVNRHGNANNVTNWSQHSTHLETISDPSSVSTNSYQMTTSNNSPKNFSHQIEVAKEEQQQQKRSNSAEHARGERGDSAQRIRSLSEGPTQSAGVRSNEETMCENEDDVRQQEQQQSVPLNNAGEDVRCFIHAPSIERNGVITADITSTVNNEEEDRQQQQQREDQEDAHHQINYANQIRTSEHETIIDSAGNRESGNAKHQLNELTECDRDSLLHSANVKSNERDACDWSSLSSSSAVLMGQTNAKPDTPSSTRSSTPREFRVSIIPEAEASEGGSVDKPTVIVPKITVVDYSDGDGSGSSGDGSPVEQEVFYDFENGKHNKRDSDSGGVNITAVEEIDEIVEEDDVIEDDDEVFHDQIPATVQNKWPLSHAQMRHSHAKLENVPEQEEDEEEEEEEDEDEEEENNNDEGNADERHFDNELERSNHFDSPERNPLKSTNTSDSNLSTSFPDSGIGDSQTSSLSPTAKHLLGGGGGVGFFANNETTTSSMRSANAATHRLPFVRDGNSTDCDETLMQCDDLEFVAEVEAANPNERLVCIESISLPDVVVESTTGNSSVSNSSASAAAAASAGDHQIININGATGNTMGNVHFIPIHVEGDKRRSVDDSVIGSGGKSFAHMNGHHHSKPTIEIVEDASETHVNRSNGFKIDDGTADKLKRELVEQKSRFNFQLEAAQKNVHNLQTKVEEMQGKIETMEQELSAKAWNVERLQGELNAAHKDDDFVRKKLKLLEDEKTNLRHKYSETEDEFKNKYEELEMQYKELAEKYKQTQSLASNLQTQLATAQSEAEEWRDEVEKIRTELEDQIRILRNALENSEAERKICEDKWQKEFEMCRTQNLDREETLMTDCEWQMRQMQKTCKEKLDKSEHGRHEALEKAEMLENELEERQQEVDDLKVYEAQVNSLRGVVSEQELSIESLMTQIENMKAELKAANDNLEEQIEAVKMIKYQCDNALYDKERQVIYRIDEVRNEAAAFWENKLYTEMTRLKNELESVYVDERREALDKLQAEHIEELRALTTRYTANEEELRIELAELQERFDCKNEEFLELREKSDNALLQTRMHLDKADREYQNAMFREEERREVLEESLRKEFEDEKLEMEEKFRERLGQVKDEFAKELQMSSQEMAEEHTKNFEKQKSKLQAEKDEALQDLADRHRKKLAAAEDQIRDIELRHQRDLKDLKAAYDSEKAALDKRDISNANEIEQLHRKCRCLTNLFEEMRMRYERRDPRAEDLREIGELRSRCESQERDLYVLTDRLREMQIQMTEMQQNGENQSTKKTGSGKSIKKPPPKTIPTNCDVIYEENEERDSPPPTQNGENEDDEEEDEEEEDEDEDLNTVDKPQLNGKELNINIDLIKEDESHMISAV